MQSPVVPIKAGGLSSTRNVIKEARQDSMHLSKLGKSIPKNLKSIWGRSNKSNMEQSKILTNLGASTQPSTLAN